MSSVIRRNLPAGLAVNAVLFLIVAAAMTIDGLWSAAALKVAALLLLANAAAVLALGAMLIFPALLESPADERKFGALLARQAGLAGEVRSGLLAGLRAEADALRQRAHLGRMVVIIGAVFLVLAFGSATGAITRLLPSESVLANSTGPVVNAKVTREQAWSFTGDQVTGALFLDIPELYHWYLGDLVNNRKAPAFTTFTFVFRAVLGWASLVTMITLARSFRSRRKSAPKDALVTPSNAPAHALAATAPPRLEVASRSMAE